VPCIFCAPETALENDRLLPQRRLPASSAGRGRRLCPLPGGFLCYMGFVVLMGSRARRARIHDRRSGRMPPGKSARAQASGGTFSGRHPERPSAFGSRAPPWSLRVG